MYALMSASELSSDSIWSLCFFESAQHQYYMPTPAEAGLFFSLSPCLVATAAERHSWRKQQKFQVFPCVGKEKRLTWGEIGRRDDANET